jgi:hypothetical protein
MTVNSSTSGGSWNVYMETAGGAVLAPGSYPNATRYPASSGNSLDVFGNGRGCNTLTGSFYVYEAVFSPVDAGLQNFKASFTQHCEGAAPALRGTVAWNAEPVTQQPPGVSNLTATASGSRELISWTNPSYSYYAYTVIRYVPGVPFAPAAISGWPVYEGRAATSATIGGLGAGARYTVSAFTVDTYGNVSGAQNLTFTAG